MFDLAKSIKVKRLVPVKEETGFDRLDRLTKDYLFLIPGAEFMAAVAYYNEQASGLGDPFIDEVERTVQLIADQPGHRTMTGAARFTHTISRASSHRLQSKPSYGSEMNKKLAAGSGVGLVVGALLGIIFDPMLGANGMAMVLGATFGIVFGAGIAAATGQSSKDAE